MIGRLHGFFSPLVLVDSDITHFLEINRTCIYESLIHECMTLLLHFAQFLLACSILVRLFQTTKMCDRFQRNPTDVWGIFNERNLRSHFSSECWSNCTLNNLNGSFERKTLPLVYIFVRMQSHTSSYTIIRESCCIVTWAPLPPLGKVLYCGHSTTVPKLICVVGKMIRYYICSRT